jgi:MFS family permease
VASLTAPLRRRDFRLLWSGMAVSLVGDGIFIVAIAWQAYSISDRPSSLAYVGLATSIPQLLLFLIGGAVSDRVNRRRVLFLADLTRATAVGSLAVLTGMGRSHLWELFVVAGLIGTATAFASPAMDALVPELVPPGELTQANGIDQVVRPITVQLAGPAIGGLAVATVHVAGAFALDALTFAFSAACVLRMATPPTATSSAGTNRSGGTFTQEVLEGLSYVRQHVWLWATFLSATLAYLLFIGPTQVLLPYIVHNSLHQGAATYGVVLASGGVGALCGGFLMGRGNEPRRPVTFIYLWWTVATLAVAGYGLATQAWGLVVASVVVNGAEAVGAVVWATLKQRRVPNYMLGRVSSIDWCISTALLPLSYALTVPVAHALGARTTLIVAGCAGGAVTFGFLFLPGLRAEEGKPHQLVPSATDAGEGGPAVGPQQRPAFGGGTIDRPLNPRRVPIAGRGQQ